MNEYRPIWMWCVLTRGFYLYSFVTTWYVLTLQRKIQRIWYQKRGDLHLPLCLCFDESLLFSTPDSVVLEDTQQASNYPRKVRVSTPHRSEPMFRFPSMTFITVSSHNNAAYLFSNFNLNVYVTRGCSSVNSITSKHAVLVNGWGFPN